MTKLSDKSFEEKGALVPFLKRMLKFAWTNHHGWIKRFIFWIAIVAIIEAMFPLVSMMLIDKELVPQITAWQEAMDNGETYKVQYQGVYKYIAIYMGLTVFLVLGIFMFIRFAGRVQEHVLYDLREAMFKKLQKLSFSFYDRSASGWLLTRLTSDTDRVAELISWGILDAIWGIVMIVFCLGAMFVYSWPIALIVLCSLPFMMLISVKIRLLVLKYSRDARKINSELTATYSEHINGVEINKSTAQEKRVSTEFRTMSDSMRQASYRAAFYTSMYFPIVVLVGSVTAALVIYFGGSMALAASSGMTVGMLAASFDYATKIFMPIVDISMFYARAQGSLSAGERIFSLLDEPLVVKNKEAAKDLENLKGAINFEAIDFAYIKDEPVLENFNLTIKEGESIALVGATGEGKSTIINLICRFYEPTGGVLKIDGEDYTNYSIESLRKQTGIVLQTPHLFSGTIRDNIRYGKLDASEEEILAAMNLVGATHFKERLDEEVGEDGSQLSLGEKQLISFARAVIANPRIFIMDEATSSIDTITEAKIQAGINQMLKGRTSVIIAHRLSTIKNCDRILVISKGGIAEDGSHTELLKSKGHYYDLYTRQLREEKFNTVMV